MKKTAKGLVGVLLALLIGAGALAAGENITDWLRETLQNEVASITLYNPTESLSEYGELVYNDRSGCVELEISAEDVSELESVVTADPEEAILQDSDSEEDEDAENEENAPQSAVPEGYVLVRVSTRARGEELVCLAEEYAMSPAERASRKAAEEAAEAAEADAASEEPAEDGAEADGTAETTSGTEPTAARTEWSMPEETEASRVSLFHWMSELSGREIILLIAALIILLAAVAELGVILSLRNRAENVAKNYIHTRAALDKTKRELTAAKSKNVALERELLQEKNKMSAIKKQFERMGRKTNNEPPAAKPAEKTPVPVKPKPKADNEKSLPDMDYLKWTL